MPKLGILRKNWVKQIPPGSSTPVWATLLRFKRERFPRLYSGGYITAVITPHIQTALYDIDNIELPKRAAIDPFIRYNHWGMQQLPDLANALYWPDIEALHAQYFAQDLLASYPITNHLSALQARILSKNLPGWQMNQCGQHSFEMVKNLPLHDDTIHAVGVTESAITIYRNALENGYNLNINERQHMIGASCINPKLLSCFLHESDAVAAASLFRCIRWFLYQSIVAEEELPF